MDNDKGILKIADLELGRAFTVPPKRYMHEISILWYKAPEVLLGSTPYSIGVDMWSDKGDSIKTSYLHHLSKLNGGAVVGEVARKFSTNENTLTVGGSYVVDPHTTFKARLNNHSNLGALLQHQLSLKNIFTLSGALHTKTLHKNPKFGLTLSLTP